MTREDDDDDRVGYGKPPKRTRFRPGQSGNPRGRSRAVDFKDWENPIQKYMLEPMTVTIKGKKVKVPVVDALIKTAIRRALEGCTALSTLEGLVGWLWRTEGSNPRAEAPEDQGR